MNTPEKIRLFIKPSCGWCREVMDWLGRRRIGFDKLDVTTDTAAWQEMEALSGQTRTPVIEVDGHVLANFGADELEDWWQQMSFGVPDREAGSSPG